MNVVIAVQRYNNAKKGSKSSEGNGKQGWDMQAKG